MSVEPIYDRRPSWRVIRAIHRELRRQSLDCDVSNLGQLTDMGQADVVGIVDLAMLAFVTEQSLRREFG